MKIKNLMFFASLSLLCSCSSKFEAITEVNRNLAGVAVISDTTSTIYLTDYFPSIEGIELGEDNSDLTLSSDGKTINIDAQNAPILGSIELLYRDKPLFIPYQKGDRYCDELKLYTTSYFEGVVEVAFTEKPDRVVAMWQNIVLDKEYVELGDNTIKVSLPESLPMLDRSYLRLFAAKDDRLFSDILVPVNSDGSIVESTSQITRHDPHSQIIYSLMIDRFYNGDIENDRPLRTKEVLPIVDYMGGDIKGITNKIKDGFFTDLGINTIWLSPITQNPYDSWGQNESPSTKFSAYHGYWPIYTTVVDERFSTNEELEELLSEAHSRDINVILDYVANHLHIDSPVLKANPDWVTAGVLEDGRENISLWDEQRLTTWFDKHIPTLDLERVEVCEPMTDSALYWIENFDFDGFRHDATKHIPEGYWRMLTSKMRERFPERRLYQIGETYGSPELIGSYVKSGMLDAQFDFNLYDCATWAFGAKDGSFVDLKKELDRSHAAYGVHNTMGYITGNHDRPRFISLAGGSLSWDEDAKAAGWSREITVGDSTSYDKLLMLNAFMLTIPGVPCIYQGDEYGVAGGNDPDNRHMMQFEGYNEREQRNRDAVAHLANFRRGSLSLMYGDYLPLVVEEDLFLFARAYLGEYVVVGFNKGSERVTVDLSSTPYFDSGELTIDPLSYDILTKK